MSWGFTALCIVTSLTISLAVAMSERQSLKALRDLKGFVTERHVTEDQVFFTLLSMELVQPVLFVLPVDQDIRDLREGDFIHVEYEVLPSLLDKPVFVRRIEIIEPIR